MSVRMEKDTNLLLLRLQVVLKPLQPEDSVYALQADAKLSRKVQLAVGVGVLLEEGPHELLLRVRDWRRRTE